MDVFTVTLQNRLADTSASYEGWGTSPKFGMFCTFIYWCTKKLSKNLQLVLKSGKSIWDHRSLTFTNLQSLELSY